MNGLMDQICELGQIDAMANCRIEHGKKTYLVGQGRSPRVEPRGEVTIRTPFQIGSVSKLLTACIVLILEKKGVLSLQTTISDAFGNCWGECSGIALCELLTHRSGIRGANGYKGVCSIMSSDEAFGTIENEIRLSYKDIYRGLYAYCGTNFRIIQAILEKLVGCEFEEILQRFLCEPLEMKATSADVRKLVEYEPVKGYSIHEGLMKSRWNHFPGCEAAAGIWASVEDLGNLMSYLLEDKMVGESGSNHDISWKDLVSTMPTGRYRNGCFVVETMESLKVGHTGRNPGYQASFWLKPKERTAAATLWNSDRPNKHIHLMSFNQL